MSGKIKRKIVTIVILLLFSTIIVASASAVQFDSYKRLTFDYEIYELSTYDNLTFTVKTDKEEYSMREPVEISLQLSNTGGENITVTTPDSRTHDFIVLNRLWHKRYQLSDGMGYAQAVTETNIPAGETVYFNSTWNQKGKMFTFMPLLFRHQVRPGHYNIVGLIPEMYAEDEYIACTTIQIKR